jgi:Na+/proline symporter
MIIIVIGMLFIGHELSGMTGGVLVVAQHASNAGLFNFFPEWNFAAIAGFIAALFTMMLGSIPQQDVFQRVTSSKNESIAVRASILGGVLYFGFAFVPMFLAYSATMIDPKLVDTHLHADSQMILPSLIMNHTPLIAQILFFGALLSAIKSCASATLLAPSVSFSENIVKGFFKHLTQKQLLLVMRITVVVFTCLVTLFAINSDLSIFKMVENAYKITLVAAFIPLVFGIYWSKANPMGGLLSMVLGILVWVGCELTAPDAVIAPQLAGLIASLFGMLIGSLLIPRELLKSPEQLG